MIMNLKYKLLISSFLLLAMLILCAGCKGSISSPETGTGASVVTEPLPEIVTNTYYCTVTDAAGQRELPPVLANGEYRFYLPGMADVQELTFNCYVGEAYSFILNGVTFTENTSFHVDLSKHEQIELTIVDGEGNAVAKRFSFHPSAANILCLYVDESLGTVKAMHADPAHETYCYGSLSYFSTEDRYDFSSSFSLKGRGNATWEDEKKGYALKLYESDDYSDKNKIAVSGMGKSANWTLISNHRDRTLIRNALAQTLAAKLGMENAVEYVFADLYLNGEYKGLYMLMEKVESGKEKVDINEAEKDSLAGGYLLEFDNYYDTPQIKLQKSGLRVTVKSPADLGSYTAIESLLNEAEIAISDEKGYNKYTKKYWYEYIDINSFAILWMVREYTMDYDANVNFRFYYDPSDGKLHGGPVWDFDNSMARNAGIYADPEFALIESGERNSNCWLTKLMRFDAFKEEIVRLYYEHIELFTTDSADSVYALAYRYADELSYSIRQNFIVWEHQLSNKSWNTPDELTYEGHFGILSDFLEKRNLFWHTYVPELVQ